jgi:hypothetical protein
MGNNWDTSGIPHKGWRCLDVTDVCQEGETAEESSYEICQMCGHERIRFVHIMRHEAQALDLRVGCVCACKMMDDYELPKIREREARNRTARRSKWLTRKWQISRNGRPWIKAGDYHVVVCVESGNPHSFRLYINKKRGARTYDSEPSAKLAAFDAIEEMKRRRNRASRQRK